MTIRSARESLYELVDLFASLVEIVIQIGVEVMEMRLEDLIGVFVDFTIVCFRIRFRDDSPMG